jgi:hypothetical protein
LFVCVPGLQCGGTGRLGVVEYAELVLLVGPVVEVAGWAAVWKHVVEPVEVAVGAAAPELGA